MARIKHTKNELKTQRESLQRYERFLPMLLLKQQQLQLELHAIDARLAQNREEEQTLRRHLRAWIRLFAEPAGSENLLRVAGVRLTESNIAGVTIPVLEEVLFDRQAPDLFLSPPWIDDGLQALETLIRLRIAQDILERQRRLVADELRTTSQRVNVFEKIKIPETREHIRVIKIFIGDQQTAAVARAKNAKRHVRGWEEAPAALGASA
jgi:V/A-type H+-transporting ATPase subunit D